MSKQNDTRPEDDPLVPPPGLLFDGSTRAADFIRGGENFTRHYLIGRARLQRHERVLDVGSGNGQKARALTAHLSPAGRYDGFDIVRAGVEWCREHYAGFPNFHFELAPLRSTHYESAGEQKRRLSVPLS